MTVVRPNSIAGINSITVQTGQALNIHDASGNLIRSLTNESGISTFSGINIGTAATIFANGNATFSGIVTASNTTISSTGIGINAATNGSASYPSVTISGTSGGAVHFEDDGDLMADIYGSANGLELTTRKTNDAIIFQLNSGSVTEKARFDSSGRLLIGTTTEGHADADDLTIRTSSRTGMTIRSADDDYGNIFFSDATSGTGEYVGKVQYYHADNTMRFGTNSTDRLIINSTGDVNITGVTTAKTFVPTEYQLGNRNILYNGAMQVSQYTTQVTGQSNVNAVLSVDRWKNIISNGGTYTVEQTDEGPADTGFNHALRYTCTTADNAGQDNLANADGYVAIEQRLEGFDVQGIQKGTTSAKPLAISLWCKSNLTGTYNVEVYDNDNARRVGSQFTVSSADTWERKTFTFAGDTTGALGNDNGDSLRFRIFLAAGNNFRTGTNSGSWAANTKNQRAQGNVSLSKATSNYFALTGVQMEVGSQPTPFEWRSHGDELARCQRYYYTLNRNATTYYWFHPINSGTYRRATIRYPITMRSAPTVSNAAGANNGSVGTPTGTQHVDIDHADFHWDVTNSSHLVDLREADFSAEF